MAYYMRVDPSCFPEVNRRTARLRTALRRVERLEARGANPEMVLAAVRELEAAIAFAQEFLSGSQL